ncbi:MAG: Rieske 2Fe-2S domain-containing protein [Actinocatenispora sp.]
MVLTTLIDRIADMSVLDRVTGPLGQVVGTVLRPGLVRDVLNGVPLGHAMHPVLVQLPVGAWTSAALLDAVPGHERSADVLIGLGVAAVAPAAISGWADWSVQHDQQKRVGLVHAVGNALAVGLYAGSLIMRLTGRRRAGRFLSYTGYGVAGAAAYLGGHLAYRMASSVNHAEDVPHLISPGWHRLDEMADLPDGVPVVRLVDNYPVLLHRDGDVVSALSDRCSHLSGPLHQGVVRDGAVTCPWHGSTFGLDDGEVRSGPATAPQHCFRTRVVDGHVEVSLPGAG